MKAVKRIVKWSFYLLLIGSVGLSAWRAQAWWDWASSAIEQQPDSKKQVVIQIPQGTSAQQIGQELEAAGLIKSAKAWGVWARWLMFKNPDGGFQAGNYQLSTSEPLKQIAEKIWMGEVAQRSFTIPEGWSIRQMAAYFERQGFFKAQDFVNAASQVPTGRYPWLPNNLPHLEGFLYPDTYQISVGSTVTPQEIVRQMLDCFEQVALPVYNQHQAKTQLSLAQWVTLGSIVEKEAVVASERSRIAGVFTNRLKKGMTLGSDPTVEYGLGIQQTKENPLTLAQVKTPSPYNTYINVGLPPTAIASPGVASLKATLEPEATDYLYFVARYDGTHVFSRTLGEHESAQGNIRDKVEAEQAEKPKPQSAKSAN